MHTNTNKNQTTRSFHAPESEYLCVPTEPMLEKVSKLQEAKESRTTVKLNVVDREHFLVGSYVGTVQQVSISGNRKDSFVILNSDEVNPVGTPQHLVYLDDIIDVDLNTVVVDTLNAAKSENNLVTVSYHSEEDNNNYTLTGTVSNVSATRENPYIILQDSTMQPDGILAFRININAIDSFAVKKKLD